MSNLQGLRHRISNVFDLEESHIKASDKCQHDRLNVARLNTLRELREGVVESLDIAEAADKARELIVTKISSADFLVLLKHQEQHA